jgi:hypothetical protein
MLVFNLFGGPGVGKSPLLHGLMWAAKRRGANVEASMEFAKELVWRDRAEELRDPYRLLEVQAERLDALDGKVDVAIAEWPLLLCLAYVPDDIRADLRNAARAAWDRHHNASLFCRRQVGYSKVGRLQDLPGALEVDRQRACCPRKASFTSVSGLTTTHARYWTASA